MLELEAENPSDELGDDTPGDRPTRLHRHRVSVSEMHEILLNSYGVCNIECVDNEVEGPCSDAQ